jgi:hypothetical protein
MPPRKKSRKRISKRTSRKSTKNYVAVTSNSYGKALRGTRIYWDGQRPRSLAKDGSIKFGKNILEILGAQFEKFRWIITKDETSIKIERGIARVRTSQQLLSKMNSELLERTRDIKNDIIRKFFSIYFTNFFKDPPTVVFVPGTLGKMLNSGIIPRLSSKDKEAINRFLPDYVSSESMGTVHKLNAKAHIDTLRGLATNLAKEIPRQHPEPWWQSYIKSNILLLQQGYILAIDNFNTSIGDTRFPDFLLVTHDNYLDVLEIKKPDTPILKLDSSRGNHYFDSEISKAVIQTENYIENISTLKDRVRSFLKDEHGLEIRVVRPRGIILAGDSRSFTKQKERADFRLLSQGIKNITMVTYDELLTRLQNYITVLEEFAGKSESSKKKPKRSAKS